MEGVMALGTNNQVFCNVWSYDIYDMTLPPLINSNLVW